MSHPKKVLEIFKHHPERWLYKGDAQVWNEMQAQLQSDIYPTSVEDFTDKIESLFKIITGISISQQETAVINEKNDSDLLSTQISPQFWQDKALPLLQVRYIITELRHSQQ